MTHTPRDIDAYIAGFSEPIQSRLRELRALFLRELPQAREAISYNIPTYFHGKRAVGYFAGWKNYVSLYPVPEGDAKFQAAIAPYAQEKSTLRISHNQPLPKAVVQEMVRLQWAAAERRIKT